MNERLLEIAGAVVGAFCSLDGTCSPDKHSNRAARHIWARTMLPRLLLTMAAANALTLPPDCGIATWRAGPSLVRVELDGGGKLNALTRSMWEALDAVLEDTDDALLITSGDAKAFSAGADVNAVASEPVDERRDFLRLEYETLEKLQERDAPTVAVADGVAFGAGAGVFMACDERIVTERSRLAMPECRIGIVPDAGALRFSDEALRARRRAVSGADGRAAQRPRFIQDGPRDALRAGQGGFRFGSTLRRAVERPGRGIDHAPRPSAWTRRGGLESGLFNEATLQAVRDAFEEGNTVDAVRADLETAREAAKKLQGSCGWATREAADGVLDVLDAAADGLQRGCPTALEITLDAIDRLAARRGDADPAAARYGRHGGASGRRTRCSAARRTSPRRGLRRRRAARRAAGSVQRRVARRRYCARRRRAS